MNKKKYYAGHRAHSNNIGGKSPGKTHGSRLQFLISPGCKRQKLFQSVFWKRGCRKLCSTQRGHDLAGEFPLQIHAHSL